MDPTVVPEAKSWLPSETVTAAVASTAKAANAIMAAPKLMRWLVRRGTAAENVRMVLLHRGLYRCHRPAVADLGPSIAGLPPERVQGRRRFASESTLRQCGFCQVVVKMRNGLGPAEQDFQRGRIREAEEDHAAWTMAKSGKGREKALSACNLPLEAGKRIKNTKATESKPAGQAPAGGLPT